MPNNPFSHEPFALWFTGLSGAGKSTLATLMATELRARGLSPQLLDDDVVRKGLCHDLGFSAADRAENIRRVAEVSKLALDSGRSVLVALISPFAEERQQVRSGLLPNFTGIDSPYENPTTPALHLKTHEESETASAQRVLRYLVGKGLLA